jgi:hypothetical protein
VDAWVLVGLVGLVITEVSLNIGGELMVQFAPKMSVNVMFSRGDICVGVLVDMHVGLCKLYSVYMYMVYQQGSSQD